VIAAEKMRGGGGKTSSKYWEWEEKGSDGSTGAKKKRQRIVVGNRNPRNKLLYFQGMIKDLKHQKRKGQRG